MLPFPDGFLWGAATSSHQVEGDNVGNDWWAWEQAPGRISDGQTSGRAADWWSGRAEQDLAWAVESGHNSHRFSLEWSRLEPEPGRWDDDAFARYHQMFAAARAMGMTTMVTLNHFTLPRWATVDGGWTDPKIVDRFTTLAARCGRAFADVVDLWATLNEPNVLAFMGYATRRWPPGRGSVRACGVAMANQMRAHAAAYEALHTVAPAPKVGIVLSMQRFEASRPKAIDVTTAAAHDWLANGAMLTALDRGVLLPPMTAKPEKIDGLARSYDWLGCNYYGRYQVRFDPRAVKTAFGRHTQKASRRTKLSDWGQPYPKGLTAQLLRLGRRGVPVFVTENGIFDNDDRLRPDYLVDHVAAVHAAIEQGADVRGYFHWSLVDNFEWAEGWSTRFGLLGLDRDTQVRTPRESAELYGQICRANAIPDRVAKREHPSDPSA